MSRKKRILHIIQSLGNGGCENMLLRTLPRLTGEFEHHIITLHALGELAPQFSAKGITVTTIHQAGILDFPSYKRLLTEVQKFSPNVIVTYLFHADMIGRLFLQRKITTPCIPFLRTTYNHPRYFVARLCEWITKPLVKQYLANSEAVKNFYVKHIGVHPEKVTVIPNGLDIDYFDSINPDQKLKELLGIKADDFVIICVANLHINKGHRYLLEAFENIYSEHPNTHLLVVGDGTEHKNLIFQIKNYSSKNNISFLGRRTDVPALLKISNCFILPTLFEGQSNAILEAMASGLPVITTDIPENQELINHKQNGWLVPSKSITALTKAIETLYSDSSLQKILTIKANFTLRNHFSLETSANKFRQFLTTL